MTEYKSVEWKWNDKWQSVIFRNQYEKKVKKKWCKTKQIKEKICEKKKKRKKKYAIKKQNKTKHEEPPHPHPTP